MVKILAIGNSFSQDATTYLHDIAKHGGIEIKVVNLLIGGCSLYTHWENAIHDLPLYECELNGCITGKIVSIKEILLSDEWNYITIQQASHDSGIIESYFPYVIQLSDYLKENSPSAIQLIHQTWAYDDDSTHDAFKRYECSQLKMYTALKAAYEKISDILSLKIIPCGDVIQTLRGLKPFNFLNGGQSLCRDGFHMHLLYGRYATAATWFESILKGDILLNNYIPPDSKYSDKELFELIKQTVHNICTLNSKE